METIFTIVLILGFIIYLMAQDSNKETKKERYGEAVGRLVTSAADSVAGAAFRLTESADKNKIRLAKEVLAQRNGLIYRFHTYSRLNFFKDYLLLMNDLKYH